MALKTLHAQGGMGGDMCIRITSGEREIIMDQPKGAGGSGLGPTPLELILAAVAGCFGTIGRFIAHQQRFELRGMQFAIEGDYDPDGLLGRNPQVRPGFQALRIQVSIDADLDQAGKQALLKEIEQRCPLADNLLHGTQLVSSLG